MPAEAGIQLLVDCASGRKLGPSLRWGDD